MVITATVTGATSSKEKNRRSPARLAESPQAPRCENARYFIWLAESMREALGQCGVGDLRHRPERNVRRMIDDGYFGRPFCLRFASENRPMQPNPGLILGGRSTYSEQSEGVVIGLGLRAVEDRRRTPSAPCSERARGEVLRGISTTGATDCRISTQSWSLRVFALSQRAGTSPHACASG